MWRVAGIVGLVTTGAVTPTTPRAVRLKDICRVKGQEANSLQGLGLVVGLKGSGDGGRYLRAIRSLATVMQYMRSPALGGAEELKDASNVALVMVTATVPPGGA